MLHPAEYNIKNSLFLLQSAEKGLVIMYNITLFTILMEEPNITTPAGEVCNCNVPFVEEYSKTLHGYASIVVCTIGIIFHAINIRVFIQRDDISGSINKILIGLAAADFLFDN